MPLVAAPSADTILHVLLQHAAAQPDGLAFAIDDGEEATWARFRADVEATAGRLCALGVQSGQVCGLQLSTGLDVLRLLFALQWIGAIPVLINTALPRETVVRRLAPLACRRVFVAGPAPAVAAGDRLDVVPVASLDACTGQAPAVPNCRAGDVAYLQLTSGTAGEPKAAAITHRNLIAQLRGLLELHRIDARDVLVNWMPLHHDFGLVHFVFAAVYFGRPVHLLQPSLTNVRAWLATIARVGGTLTASPDFGYRLATRAVDPANIDLSSLRLAINGGEPVRRSTVEEFETRFSLPGVVRPGYGLGEATLALAALPPGVPLRTDEAGTVSCGPPLTGIDVRIAGEDGRIMAPGETGEIMARGAAVFDGYWLDPDGTRTVLKDGWLATGDLGFLDADGHLYVSGRRRAMIKRGGVLVPARVVEEVVDRVDGVRLSAAIAGQGEDGAEDVVVVAEAARRVLASPERRLTLCRAIERAVQHALGFPPGDVVLVAPKSIPMSENGKLRHVELRERYRSGSLASAFD